MVAAFAQCVEWLRQACAPLWGLQTVSAAPYLFRPLVMLVLMGIVCGVSGVLVNLRCAEFNAEATIHAIFPGIVAGALYGGIDQIIPYASGVAIIVALCLTWVTRQGRRGSSEAGTAVVLTSFFSLGMILSLWKGDLSGQLEALMFGRLLEVSDQRLFQAVVVCLLSLLIIGVTWKQQVLYAFDPLAAKAGRLPTGWLDFALNAALAAVVVAAASAIGTLLVIGYLVVPGAAARLWSKTVKGMVICSIVCGIAGGYFGLLASTIPASRPISPQAAVALCVIALYFVALLGYLLRQQIHKSDQKTSLGFQKEA